jgi:hypothetical protein
MREIDRLVGGVLDVPLSAMTLHHTQVGERDPVRFAGAVEEVGVVVGPCLAQEDLHIHLLKVAPIFRLCSVRGVNTVIELEAWGEYTAIVAKDCHQSKNQGH